MYFSTAAQGGWTRAWNRFFRIGTLFEKGLKTHRRCLPSSQLPYQKPSGSCRFLPVLLYGRGLRKQALRPFRPARPLADYNRKSDSPAPVGVEKLGDAGSVWICRRRRRRRGNKRHQRFKRYRGGLGNHNAPARKRAVGRQEFALIGAEA